jgi:hypothetical protein
MELADQAIEQVAEGGVVAVAGFPSAVVVRMGSAAAPRSRFLITNAGIPANPGM